MTRQAISTSGAPSAIGPYSQGIASGDLVFCSGQLGLDPMTGELAEGVEAQAERALRNLAAVLEEAGGSLSTVVKTTVYLADMERFDDMNRIYGEHFGDHRPARATVEVSNFCRALWMHDFQNQVARGSLRRGLYTGSRPLDQVASTRNVRKGSVIGERERICTTAPLGPVGWTLNSIS